MKSKQSIKILLIEDEKYTRRRLTEELSAYGIVTAVENKADAFYQLENNTFDLACVDLYLQDHKLDGFEILKETKKKQIYSVIISSSNDEKHYHKAVNELGAMGFYDKREFIKVIDLILKEFLLKHATSNNQIFKQEFITQDERLIDSIKTAMKYRSHDSSILLLGESGVGKTMLAKIFHESEGREKETFVELNAASIPENLIESTLFGHIKGAFTGADTNKKGLLYKANRGTVFIDEIAAIPLHVQAKLLKCLDEKKFTPVGGEEEVHSNFTLISATCEDIKKKVAQGKFRSDLYFRIAQETITIPPLRERKDDIPLLVQHLLSKSHKKISFEKAALELLKHEKWDDNTRGLIGVIKHCLTLPTAIITEKNLKIKLSERRDLLKQTDLETPIKKLSEDESIKFDFQFIADHGLQEYLRRLKAQIIKEVYTKYADSDIEQALKILKISQSTLYEQLTYLKDNKHEKK